MFIKKLRFFALLILISAQIPLCAAPYGHSSDVEDNFTQKEDANFDYYKKNNIAHPFLMYKVADRKTIFVCGYLGKEEEKTLPNKDFITQIYFALRTWTVNPLDMVFESGREDEFKDLKLLTHIMINNGAYDEQNKITNIDISGEPCDLSVIYDKDYCTEAVGGSSYYSTVPFPLICLNIKNRENMGAKFGEALILGREKVKADVSTKDYFDTTLGAIQHEMGHAFGIGDQYEAGMSGTSPLYSTSSKRKSLMKCDSSVPTCDDTDAVISLYYRIKNKPKTFKSLCNDGLIIKDGIPVEGDITQKFVQNGYEETNGVLYTINKHSRDTKQFVGYNVSKYNTNDEGDAAGLSGAGVDLSYFSKGVVYARAEQIDGKDFIFVVQGAKAQRVPVKFSENKITPIGKPINLVAQIKKDGTTDYDTPANIFKSTAINGLKKRNL